MKQFMDENFLLDTKTAQDLFHNHAAKMPIIDYHCHLIPEMVANDHKFKSITELWLGGDHYKWRAMRTNGVDERFCTVLILATGRSSRSGLKQCLIHSVTLSITGLTWSSRLLSVSISSSALRQPVKSTMSVTRSCSCLSSALVA